MAFRQFNPGVQETAGGYRKASDGTRHHQAENHFMRRSIFDAASGPEPAEKGPQTMAETMDRGEHGYRDQLDKE